ncbi:Na+/H+ antiporter NhaA [Helicobacter saguini]|uniref:Na(+)/H(+) antiporter NhaA n=1 Tax=Helicobacter saguini TaxID=1548018 RepID=A0A347VQ72_9HELI|nr:Na+/H+ antiporter NhaA [Helicobacter saguini]MWV61051.1 Na+/H+ antiporter NhaA [Helicobacter saguini]MWV68280.1 Na+/H+ antiporter NhaA [Helicobacter saguini]MWV70255.1 Na+/H+ antiporter NhaA [Helicobacter saguini]MWV72158.1 Na+/H+ antiporter NhaA [Helicobacter saguini]TLD95219.1 Na+/H+ antiporter NhaA [Helicobacter saguini]
MRLTQALSDFIKSESFGGIFLAISTLLALIIANSPLQNLYHEFFHLRFSFSLDLSPFHLNDLKFSMSMHDFINDILMSFFFLLVGLEIKREMLFGELNSVSKAAFPAIAALGGMIVPGAIYYALNFNTPSYHGFGIPMATDIAFALGVMLMLGKRVPLALKIFLVTLAVVDDLGAIVVIALFYGGEIHFAWLFASALVVIILSLCNYFGVKMLRVYILLGILLWIFVHLSGIHATIAAVVLAFCIPVRATQDFKALKGQIKTQLAELDSIDSKLESKNSKPASILLDAYRVEFIDKIQRNTQNTQNPLLRLEHFLQPYSAYFIMPLFAFANAGVSVSGDFDFNIDRIFFGIFLGLLVGKPVGIFLACFLCEKLRIAVRPSGVSWLHILGAGMLAGIGFTMSLFVSALAFDNESAKELAKVSILIASLSSCIIGVIFLLLVGSKR